MLGRVHVNRNTASVILNTADVVFFKSHGNSVAVSGHGFVYTVVNNLINKMMQSIWTGGTYIHTRSLSNGFQPL